MCLKIINATTGDFNKCESIIPNNLEFLIQELNNNIIHAELVYFITYLKYKINFLNLFKCKLIYNQNNISISSDTILDWENTALSNCDFFTSYKPEIVNGDSI